MESYQWFKRLTLCSALYKWVYITSTSKWLNRWSLRLEVVASRILYTTVCLINWLTFTQLCMAGWTRGPQASFPEKSPYKRGFLYVQMSKPASVTGIWMGLHDMWHFPTTFHLYDDTGCVVLVGARDRIRQKRRDPRQCIEIVNPILQFLKDREVPSLPHVAMA